MPENTPYIVAAYAVTWLAILAYGWRLRLARRDAERRLEQARRAAGGAA